MGRNLNIFLIGFVLFSYAFLGKITNAVETNSQLSAIAHAIEKQRGSIIEWSLHTRETNAFSSREELLKKANFISKAFQQFHWEMTENEKDIKMAGVSKAKTYVETIKLSSVYKNNTYYVNVSYDLKGEKHESVISLQKIEQNYMKKVSKLYNKKPTVFSCIKGSFNDKIDNAFPYYTNALLNELHATETESLKESEFYSISAYSPHMTQHIQTKNDKMNMQIGVRKNKTGDKIIAVIGTPILTIEY